MKNESLIQAIKFTLFSVSAGIIQAVAFALLESVFPLIFGFSLNYWVCYLPSLLLSIIWNFTFNRKFTFKSANNVPMAMLKVLAFYAVFTPVTTILGNYLSKRYSITEDSLLNYAILGGTMILNFVLEFIFQKYFVFNEKK